MAQFKNTYTGAISNFDDPDINWQNIIGQGLVPVGQGNTWSNSQALQSFYQQNPGAFTPGLIQAYGLTPPAAPAAPSGGGGSSSEQMLADFQKQLKASLDAQIQNIETMFGAKKVKMEDINKRFFAAQQTAGIRGGSSRYAPTVEQGILSTEETEGLNRLSAIDADKAAAISAANQAYQDKNWQILSMQMEIIEQKETDRQKALEDQIKKTQAETMKREEEAMQKDKEGVINSIIAGGVTDPLKIFGELRKNGVTDISSEDIKTFFDNVMPKPTKEEDKIKNAYEFKQEDVGKLLATGMAGEDIQTLQDVFNKSGLYGKVAELEGKSLAEFLPPAQLKEIKKILYPPPKVDADKNKESFASFGEQSDALSLSRMVFGGGRAMSDADREQGAILFKKGQQEGLDVFQMAERASGFIVRRDRDLADGLRNTLLGIDEEKGLANYDMAGLARLINEGQSLSAVRKVENAAMDRSRELSDPNAFINEDDVKYIDGKVNEITSLLGQGWANEVGAFTGTFNSWLKKKFGGGEATKIKAKITSITSSIANKRAGSAITEEEWERLVAPNVPSMNEAAKTWNDKMNELVDDSMSRLNAERSVVSLPPFSIQHIRTPESRTKLYMPSAVRELDDLLSSDSWSGGVKGPYNSSVWLKAP